MSFDAANFSISEEFETTLEPRQAIDFSVANGAAPFVIFCFLVGLVIVMSIVATICIYYGSMYGQNSDNDEEQPVINNNGGGDAPAEQLQNYDVAGPPYPYLTLQQAIYLVTMNPQTGHLNNNVLNRPEHHHQHMAEENADVPRDMQEVVREMGLIALEANQLKACEMGHNVHNQANEDQETHPSTERLNQLYQRWNNLLKEVQSDTPDEESSLPQHMAVYLVLTDEQKSEEDTCSVNEE